MENTKKRKVFDHPILGMFVSTLLVYLLIIFAVAIVGAILGTTQLSSVASSLTIMITSIICLLFHKFWFRKELHNFFSIKGLEQAFAMAWSIIIAVIITRISDVCAGKPTANVFIALILGLSPGISEEIAWRIIPISIAMRNKDKKGVIMMAYILPSLTFGIIHLFNIFVGADILATLFQFVYSIGLGLIFAAIYIRTGNMWCSIILHSLVDTVAFLTSDMQQSNGVLSESFELASYWPIAIFIILFFTNAFLIFKKDKRANISDVWDKIWVKNLE